MMPNCDMQRLVEARHDGRLAARETESIERHLRSCRSCRALEDDLDRLAELGRRAGDLPPPSALEHRRRRLALLREAAVPRSAPSSTSRRPTFAFALAAATLMVFAWLALRPHDVQSLHARLPSLQPPTSSDAPARTSADKGEVRPAPRARFRHEHDGSVERVQLSDGTISIHVAPLDPGERFLVLTHDAEVEVRGTRFSVRAVEDDIREVIVEEGLVEVRHGDEAILLSAGESWRVDEPAAAAASTPAAPATAEPAASAVDEDASGTSEPGDERSAEPREEPARAQTPEPDAVSQEFIAAMRQLEQGRYSEAEKALRAFARANPRDPRAEDADYLSIIALQRAGRHAAAAQAARAYLGRYPHGARRTEVEQIAGPSAD